MAVAVRSVEVVVAAKGAAAKGAAATVAAKEEVAKEGAAVAEETVSGACVVRQGACRSAAMIVSDEPGASCSKRSCNATCCAEEHHGMSESVSMASGARWGSLARACRGRMKARASRMGIGRGLMKGSCSRRSMRVAAGASWALWPKWEEEGGGRPATTSSFVA